MAAVQAYLEKQLRKDIYKAFSARLDPILTANGSQRSNAIEIFLKNGDCPPWVYPKLRFLRTFLDIVEHDLDTFGWLSSKCEQASLESLAAILFPRDNLDSLMATDTTVPKNLTSNVLNRIRTRILNDEPLVVLLSAVKTGLFSGIAKDRPGLKAVLSVLIDEGLDICDPTLSSRASTLLFPESDKTGDTMENVVNLVKSLKILSRVVDDPQDLEPLLSAGFTTIRQISSRNKNDFADRMQKSGMNLNTALKIQDSAERLDCWNENLWLTLIEASRKDCIPITLDTQQAPNDGNSALTTRNNLTDIFRLEDAACEECCSVTSLSAYFAALLKFLRDTALLKAVRVPGLNSSIPRQLDTVLDVLTNRRADLLHLELSCENSQTLIPYISLVNEVLESYIRFYNQESLDPIGHMDETIRAYQTPPGHIEEISDDHGPLYRPGNTDYEVYQKVVSPLTYPMTVFPFDLMRNIQKSTIDIWGVSPAALVKTFAIPSFISQYIAKSRRKYINAEVSSQITIGQKEVLSRQYSSEILELSQSDFAIITGETFFPPWFADLLNGFTPEQGIFDAGCPWDAATLWGFENEKGKDGSARVNMLDTSNGLGLSFIKRQFMQRSQLEFQDVMELVKTLCFSQHCIITTTQKDGVFENSIESLRLYSNASSPPFQPLTEKLAFALQAFIRLQSRLNWTIRELDAAIYLFHNLEIETSSQSKKVKSENFNGYPIPVRNADLPPPELLAISPFKIKAVASVKELAQLVGMKESALLSLWGPMDAFGVTSFFHKNYMRPDLGAMSPIFSMSGLDQTPNYFAVNGKPVDIGEHMEAVCYALKWPVIEAEQLFKVSDLDGSSELNIDSFTSLYRYTILCRMFAVKPKDCIRFFQVFFPHGSAFVLASPQATLEHIKKWKGLLEAHWTVDELLEAFSKSTIPMEPKLKEQSLKFAMRLLKAADDVRKLSPIQLQGPVPNINDIKDCSSRLFEPATATAVTNLIEGEFVPVSIDNQAPAGTDASQI